MKLRVQDGASVYELPITGDRVRFGRSAQCDVVLEDGGISREHAELERSGDGWVIADLGSRNGTYVNDEPVHRTRLRSGDRIRLGPDVHIEIVDEVGATSVRRPRPSGMVIGGAAAEGAATEESSSATVRPAGRVTGASRGAGASRSAHANPFQETVWELEPRSASGRVHRLRGAMTTVGRDPSAGLTLDDESVSRMHARIDIEHGQLTVTDLKSSNGTTVNGEPVLRSPVHAGDLVSFGDVAYRVHRRVTPAWMRIGGIVGAVAALVIAALVATHVSRDLEEQRDVKAMSDRVRTQAVEATRSGIEASAQGDPELARAHLMYAADLLLLSDLAPRGSSLQQPTVLFRGIVQDLPPAEREFDFARALDPATVEASQARVATMTNREYIEHQIRRFSVELGQDPQVPAGFLDQVEGFVNDYTKYRGSMEQMLRRARDVQPRIRQILATRHLPEAFCYVAWVESGLDPMQESHVGALGLWQLMPETARQYHLFVKPGDKLRDERTNVERSTAAAADYFSSLLRAQGPEYFMLVLASYNRGHNALERAKQRIDDPMMRSKHKYWYLVEKQLLPEETRNYVPRIFAVRIIAEAPERFGFTP